jgi:hypothetical protein
MYLIFLAFTSRPISLLATAKAFVIFLYSMYVSTQYITIIGDVYNLISNPPGLPEPA